MKSTGGLADYESSKSPPEHLRKLSLPNMSGRRDAGYDDWRSLQGPPPFQPLHAQQTRKTAVVAKR